MSFPRLSASLPSQTGWAALQRTTALERALELLDLTLADPRHLRSTGRLREIARAREVLCDFLAGSNVYGSTETGIRRYFDAYAIAASLGH